MILGFKQAFPWEEQTNFREKILAGVGLVAISGDNIKPYGPILQDGFIPKIHTIREDKHNRWKAGMRIQMVYRGPKYSIADHFNKGIEELSVCKSAQTIQMKWGERMEKIVIHVDSKLFAVIPCVSNIRVREPFLSNGLLLAQNDGFENVIDFAKWFKWDDFTGKIIHWSDFKY